jgi:cell wall-associated NlpC family hydrolase
MAHILEHAEHVVRELQRELGAAYGFTLFDVTLALDEARSVVHARGTVLVPRLSRKLTAALLDSIPEGWRVDVTELHPLRTGDWRAPPDGLSPIYAKLPKRERALATEILASDGPLELLVEVDDAKLVRVMDGTVGWLERTLGESVSMPAIEPAHGTAEEVVTRARALLGAPYRLGGATAEGLDCSALTQRAFRDGLGVILPRHSTDQLAIPPRHHEELRFSGDLMFAWTEREGPCHVGIVVDAPEASVIHASLSRKSVVEDPLDRFVENASRIEIVALPDVLGFHEDNVGTPALELPEHEEPEV